MTYLLFLLLFSACSLINQEPPNESPVLQFSQVDTLQINRGGEIRVEVRADDEDDDPLFYTWTSFGAGSFRDSARAVTTWFAPEKIRAPSEKFVLQVTIRDRWCGVVADLEDRARCEEETAQVVETFVVEVVQRPPIFTTSSDTTLSFEDEALVTLDAFGRDPDGDVLEYEWEQLKGPELDLQEEQIDNGHSRMSAILLTIGYYLFKVEVNDGQDTVSVEIAVDLLSETGLPGGGIVQLVLPTTGEEYEIDVYEFPNKREEIPVMVTWFEAAQICASEGKRLCRRAEWEHACRGEEGRLYSSSDDPELFGGQPFGRRFCNTPGSEFVGLNPDPETDRAPSGSFFNCASSAGVYDLTGNLSEWVGNIDGNVWVGQTSRSDVIFLGSCGSFSSEMAPLPEGFDFTDQEQIDNLSKVTYGPYTDNLFGFRCCR